MNSQHGKQNKNTKYTTKHVPWDLELFFRISESGGEAMFVERFIKNQKRVCHFIEMFTFPARIKKIIL